MADTDTLRQLNDVVQGSLHHVLDGLSDEQISYSAPVIDERSISEVVAHAYVGVLIFGDVIQGKGWPPQEKWTQKGPTTSADLLALVDSTHEQLDKVFTELSEELLEQKYAMPWGGEMTGIEAFTGSLSHALVHAGNIQGVRAIGGFPTPPEQW